MQIKISFLVEKNTNDESNDAIAIKYIHSNDY